MIFLSATVLDHRAKCLSLPLPLQSLFFSVVITFSNASLLNILSKNTHHIIFLRNHDKRQVFSTHNTVNRKLTAVDHLTVCPHYISQGSGTNVHLAWFQSNMSLNVSSTNCSAVKLLALLSPKFSICLFIAKTKVTNGMNLWVPPFSHI